MSKDCQSWVRRNWHWLAFLALLLSLCASVLAGTVQRAVEHVPWNSNHLAQATKTAQQQPTADMQRRMVRAEFPLGPLLFIGLLLGVGALWGKALGVEATAEQAERAKRRSRKPAERSLEDEIRRIGSSDPAFNTEAFLRRSSHAFRVFQRAWNKQDLSPIRHLVSDAIYERSSLQIAEMQRQGVCGVLEDLLVQDKTIAQVDVSEHYQTITVRFQASAKSYRVDANRRFVSGDRQPQSFVECWSFVRRPGATTLATGGLLEGNCPNCGTPLHLNQTGICSSCDAKVWSGRYDWVLTEITHGSEWRKRPHHDVPGVAGISRSDPAFCLQQLHDRVSAMFWRRITAWQAGDVTLLRNVATADYCQALAEELAPDPDGTRRIPVGAEVGAVETEGILCETPLDQALVRIHWNGGAERLALDGARHQTIRISFHVSYFLLVRKHGVQGSLDDALLSSHCRSCGSPATARNVGVCEHCGIPLVDVERDWLLRKVYFEDEPPVRVLLSQFEGMGSGQSSAGRSGEPANRSPSSGRELMAWAIQVMLADDKIEEEEEALLKTVAAKQGLSAAELERLLAAARAGELTLALPHSAGASLTWLGVMADMAFADGRVSDEEKKVLEALGKRLGMGKKKISRVISSARRRLQGETKQRSREGRGRRRPKKRH